MFVDRYLAEGLKLDYWWMDAGWYPNTTGWRQTGTWEVDSKRFPRGLRAITDHAHAKGVRGIVWSEPEWVAAGTWLAENHPEWSALRLKAAQHETIAEHFQLNCADKDELIDARKHPERHQDLVVRIAGYSVRFVLLEPEWQDELIARTVYAASA